MGRVVDKVYSVCSPVTGRYTEATFRAYDGNMLVDSERARADDAVTPIRFTLAGTPRIDRVEVQVCHQFRTGNRPPICVATSYRRPAA